MATKKSKPADEQKPKKLDKTHPDYFKRIGALGGRRNLEKNGKEFFSDIARLSHAPGCRPESPARGETSDDSVAGSRDKVRSRRS